MKKIIKIAFISLLVFLNGCSFLNPEEPTNDDCIIKFYDGNTLIKSITLKKGDDFPNENYQKEGFEFVGWDLNNDGNPDQMPIAVTTHQNLRAVLIAEQRCKYIFAYNGESVFEEIVKVGTSVDNYNLVIESDKGYDYNVTGWYVNDFNNPVSFPYILNESTVFYPIIEATRKEYTYTVFDGEDIIKKENGFYNDIIDYPVINGKIIDGKYAAFIGWTYETENRVPINETFISNLTSSLIIRSNFTTDQVCTIIIDDIVESIYKVPGEVLNLNYGKPSKNQKVVWYTDENYTCELASNIMIEGSLVLYGRYEEQDEIDTSILECDYQNINEVNTEYELLVLFNALILNKVETKEFEINFEYESLDSLFDYLKKNVIDLRTYTVEIKYVDKKFTFTFTYEDKGGLTSENTYYTQLNSYNLISDQDKLPEDFKLPVDKFEKNYRVVDSESLYFCLEHGYRPVIDNDNTELINLYNKMRSVLLEINPSNRTEFNVAKAIYEWLILNVVYDKEVLDLSMSNNIDVNKYNAFLLEGVFNDHKAVCDGISKAYVCLANMMGIKCVRSTGVSTKGNVNHAWNKICIDGNMWYIVDATSGGVIVDNYEALTYEFFLIDTNTYSEYYIDNNELYPFIKTKYNYNAYESLTTKPISDIKYQLNFENKDDLVICLKEFFKDQDSKTFNFKMGYYKGNDFAAELSSLAFQTNVNIEFTYLISNNIVTIIKK